MVKKHNIQKTTARNNFGGISCVSCSSIFINVYSFNQVINRLSKGQRVNSLTMLASSQVSESPEVSCASRLWQLQSGPISLSPPCETFSAQLFVEIPFVPFRSEAFLLVTGRKLLRWYSLLCTSYHSFQLCTTFACFSPLFHQPLHCV